MSAGGPSPQERLRLLGGPRLLAAPLFVYGCVRAATLSITHDEALTYLLHVRAPWRAVLLHTAPLPSNNHLLNTAAVKALLTVLPPTELVLRLPALAGLALFLWAAVRLAGATATGWRRPLAFLLLAANPFLLDLLVLSRGYALALGLWLVALARLVVPTAAPRPRLGHAWLPAAAAGAAVLANVGFVFAFIATAAAAAFLALLGEAETVSRLRRAGRTLVPYLAAAVVLALAYPPSVLARIRQPLVSWGGSSGIWADTVPSLVDATLYGAAWTRRWHDMAVTWLPLAVVVLLLAAFATLSSRRQRQDRPLIATVLFLLAWCAQIVAAHLVLGMPYPIDRAASPLVPALSLAFVVTWEGLAAARRPLGTHLAAAAAAVVLVHFAICLNLSHTFLWRYDADSKAAMRAVASSAATAPPGSLRLGVSWLLEPAANFYRVTWGLTGLAPVTRQDPRAGFDLYYLTGDAPTAAGDGRLQICATFPDSGTLLAVPPGVTCPPGQRRSP